MNDSDESSYESRFGLLLGNGKVFMMAIQISQTISRLRESASDGATERFPPISPHSVTYSLSNQESMLLTEENHKREA